jgi:hypothetical protein
MQQKLIAGDSLNFTTAVADFPPSAGFTLKYRLAPRTAANAVIALTAAVDGAVYRVQVAASTTAAWAPDVYTWASWVEKTGESYTVGSGLITISPDPRQAAAGFDDRSQEEKDLAALNSAISARINGGAVIEYTIGGRSLKKEPMTALLEMKSRLDLIVARQRRGQAAANGAGKSGRLSVRFI